MIRSSLKPPSAIHVATGPKIRVPRGVLSSRMITAAFSSNLIYEPSRRAPDLVRTITALQRHLFNPHHQGSLFYRCHNNITGVRKFTFRTTKNFDSQDFACATVVCDFQTSFSLESFQFSPFRFD